MKHRNLIVLILGVVFVFTSGIAQARPTNKELKIGMTQEFDNLNPLIMKMLATVYIQSMVARPLNVLDADLKTVEQLVVKTPTLKNGLARWIEEDGKKKLQSTWEIKAAAKWGDGQPVTAADFVFTWKVGMSPNISITNRTLFENIERVDVDPDNPKKFTLVYKKAKFDYYKMYGFLLPKHIEEPIFEKTKDKAEAYGQNTTYSTDPTNPGLYNGPYKIKEVKLGSHVIFVPNPMFFGKKPAIQRIIVKLIPNTATLEANLRSGTIDMVSVLGFTLDQALAFEKRVQKDRLPFRINYKTGIIYEHIDLKLGNPFLKDINVRKALVHAINRDELCQALFEGKQQKAIHSYAPLDPWFIDDPEKIVLYPYSRRKAKKLLDKAGWKTAPDGYRYKDGQKLSLELMTTAQNKTRENVQVFLKSAWKSVGVDIQIKNEPAKVFFGQTVRKARYKAMAMFAWVSQPEVSPRGGQHSQRIPTKANNWSGSNAGGWVNKEVDQLIEMLEVEFSLEKRRALVAKFLYHYTNEVPTIPLYYRADATVTPKNLKGYHLTGHLYSATYHVEDWTLE